MLRILALYLLISTLVLPAQSGLAQVSGATPTPTGTATSRSAIRRSTVTPTQTPTPLPGASIHAPQPGQALQGNIPISGYTAIAGFASAEISFAYANDPTGTWFLIDTSSSPVANALLAEWDTTTITDGEYTLRLVVQVDSSQPVVVTVKGVRVRNYSPIETSTPTPVTPTTTPQPGELPVSSLTPSPTITPPAPTPTSLPPNPAQVTEGAIATSLGKGALAILGFFALMGLYQTLKNLRERS